MILDSLANSQRYPNLPARAAAALDYLRRTDFSQTPDGKYALDGDRLTADVKHCRTRTPEEAVWETHRRYIDVHYMIEGEERIGCLPFRDDLPIKKPYDPVSDGTVYDVQGESRRMAAGDFAVCLPDDVHAADLAAGTATAVVRKVVLKCLVSDS